MHPGSALDASASSRRFSSNAAISGRHAHLDVQAYPLRRRRAIPTPRQKGAERQKEENSCFHRIIIFRHEAIEPAGLNGRLPPPDGSTSTPPHGRERPAAECAYSGNRRTCSAAVRRPNRVELHHPLRRTTVTQKAQRGMRGAPHRYDGRGHQRGHVHRQRVHRDDTVEIGDQIQLSGKTDAPPKRRDIGMFALHTFGEGRFAAASAVDEDAVVAGAQSGD